MDGYPAKLKRRAGQKRCESASNFTGEQLQVLTCMLTTEMDGVIGIKQKEIAKMLNIAESNVSRSIKALTEAGLLSKKVERGYNGLPLWHRDNDFEK